jgi:phage shock protein C
MRPKKRQRYRLREGRVLGGVCAGFAQYYDANVVIVRLIFVLLALAGAGAPGILAYLLLWGLTPLEPPPRDADSPASDDASTAQPSSGDA